MPINFHSRRLALIGAVILLVGERGFAQCPQLEWFPEWVQVRSPGSERKSLWSMHLWDPDGSGPQAPTLVAIQCAIHLTSPSSSDGYICQVVCQRDDGTWSPLGPEYATNWSKGSLTVLPNGDLYLVCPNVNSSYSVRQWIEGGWVTIHGPVGGTCGELTPLSDGTLIGFGSFFPSGVSRHAVHRWNGQQWSTIDSNSLPEVACAVPRPDGTFLVGGNFLYSNSGNVYSADLRLAGLGLSAFAGNGVIYGTISDMLQTSGGDVIAVGSFSAAGFHPVNGVAKWHAGTWSALGTGVSSSEAGGPSISCIKALPDSRLVIAGTFSRAGGVQANGVAIWNGTSWSALIDWPAGYKARKVVVLPNGDIAIQMYDTASPSSLCIARHRTAPVADIGSPNGLPGHDGVFDNNDFIVFIDRFFNMDPTADIGTKGGWVGSDGTFDNNDFVVFVDLFFRGC